MFHCHSTVGLDPLVCIHSFTGGYLSCFLFLATVNRAAAHFALHVCMDVSSCFSWLDTWSGTAGSDNHSLAHLRNPSLFSTVAGLLLPSLQPCTGLQCPHLLSTLCAFRILKDKMVLPPHLGKELVPETFPNHWLQGSPPPTPVCSS